MSPAFLEELMKQYTAYLYVIVRNTLGGLGTREDIEECVSDVFFECYQKWEQTGWERDNLKGYLALLAKRRAVDLYRRLARQQGATVSAVGSTKEMSELLEKTEIGALSKNGSDRQEPEQRFLRKEERTHLLEVIRGLGEPDTGILIRRFFLEQPVRQIAKALDMKENTVSVRVRRALEKIEAELGGVEHE